MWKMGLTPAAGWAALGSDPRGLSWGDRGRRTVRALLWVSVHLLSPHGPTHHHASPLSHCLPIHQAPQRSREPPQAPLPAPPSKASPLNTLRGSQVTHPFLPLLHPGRPAPPTCGAPTAVPSAGPLLPRCAPPTLSPRSAAKMIKV